ncbi:MAG: hypothetical protein R3182_09615, partial [Draconibacterium sp.]|nr:hypothetical protein [Draconibacterium sp.]
MRISSKRKLIILTALTLLIFSTGCKTVERIYIYPDFIHPEIEAAPEREYIDGGFKVTDKGVFL